MGMPEVIGKECSLSFRSRANTFPGRVCSQHFFFLWELERYYFLLKLKASSELISQKVLKSRTRLGVLV